MGREEYRFSQIAQPEENLDQFFAADGIQTAGGLIQDEQIRAVAQGQGQGVFDLHAVGKLRRGFVLRETETFHIFTVGRVVPSGEEGFRDSGDGFQFFPAVISHSGGDEADLFHDFPGMLLPEQTAETHLARIGMNEGKNGIDGRRFAGAVPPDKPRDFSGFQGEGKILQLKFRIVFT